MAGEGGEELPALPSTNGSPLVSTSATTGHLRTAKVTVWKMYIIVPHPKLLYTSASSRKMKLYLENEVIGGCIGLLEEQSTNQSKIMLLLGPSKK